MALSSSRRDFLTFAGGFLGSSLFPLSVQAQEVGGKASVSGHLQGAEAGQAVLASGGNAADAAVAAALVAAVVAVPGTGLGGYGGSLVVARPNGEVSAIDFDTAAPAALKPDTFRVDDKGNVTGDANTHGWLAAGVPGVPAGLQLAIDAFGSKPFAELVKPAIRYAREGFPIDRTFAAALKPARERLARDPGSARVFFNNGQLLGEGATYRNPDLADLLQTLANRGGVASFYTGDVAKQIAAAFRKNGGLVTTDDLAAYRAQVVKPAAIEFHGHTVYTPPPPSGGLTVLQTLSSLAALDWAKMDRTAPATTQALVEALRVAWNDRIRYLGDLRFVDVPIERLLSRKYAEETSQRVQIAVKTRKPIEGVSDGRPSGGTIHITACDAAGMMAAITLTHGSYFGAQVTVDGLGLLLGHGMSRFDPRPGRANSPAPGKRPLHNMCPTVVTRDGKPVLALGAIGGRRIVNAVTEALADHLGRGQSWKDSVKAPRLHTEGDYTLMLEPGWPDGVRDYLKSIGYEIKSGAVASLNGIDRDAKTGDAITAAR